MSSADVKTISQTERYLREWHHRNPDASRRFAGACDADGRSSYQRLALLAAHSTSVLDVACGTGWLLSLIRDTAPSIQLAGIDLSESELRLAAKRLPLAKFAVARAQTLPLDGGSADLVVCHMALMLLDNPEQMLAECHRALRGGGRFSAVTNRRAPLDGAASTVMNALRPTWARANVELQTPRLGDPRTLDAGALAAMVGAQFDQVSVEEFAVVSHVPRGELLSFLRDSIYGFDATPIEEAQRILDSLALPELVEWSVPMLQVYGTRL
jgi:ubiquinone/menaquinone biosynthesis C-methylase UbiE